MRNILFASIFLFSTVLSYSQANNIFIDSLLKHASVSVFIEDTQTGEIIYDHDSEEGIIPASVLKLYTTAAALELLGPDYSFSTVLAYSGHINNRGELDGDLIIKGGGDPALGSKRFPEYYNDFPDKWVEDLLKLGIKRIKGQVITDDSNYDYQPVPPKWLWEDIGNYYGAGAYGLSVFDNTYEICLDTYSDSTKVKIKAIIPSVCRIDLSSRISVSKNTDLGYVFSAPYSTNGWLAGTVPSKRNDLVLRASINDPPLIMAKLMDKKLKNAGVKITREPSTIRLSGSKQYKNAVIVSVVKSPPLSQILYVLNHQSVNLYAEHLLKELGKVFRHEGSTAQGIEVIYSFLKEAGLSSDGVILADGSGLSSANLVTSRNLVSLLIYMEKNGKYFTEYKNSFATPGEGTLKTYFRDPVFTSRLSAKSGSMTRVRSYAGYFTTLSQRHMAFSIIVNNFTGPSVNISTMTENLIKQIIVSK